MPIDVSTFRPVKGEMFRDRTLRRNREDLERVGFFEVVTAAASAEWIIPSLYRRWQRSGYRFDPNFTGVFALEEKAFKEFIEELPPIWWEPLTQAVSMEHATVIRDQLKGVAETNQILSQGWGGFTARVGAAILDPVAVGIGLATGGIGAVATKVERTREIARIGLISGVTEASIEAVISDIDPTRGADDIIYAGLGGAILGSSAAVFFTRKRKAAEILRHHIERADAEDAIRIHGEDAAISEKGQAYFEDPAAAGRKWINDAAEAQGLDPDDAAEFADLQRSGALGTLHERVHGKPREGESADFQEPSTVREELTEAQRPTTEPEEGVDPEDFDTPDPKRAGDFVLDELNEAKSKFAPVRMSIAGRVGANPSPRTRMAATAMTQDALNKADNKPQQLAASEWVVLLPLAIRREAGPGNFFRGQRLRLGSALQ